MTAYHPGYERGLRGGDNKQIDPLAMRLVKCD